MQCWSEQERRRRTKIGVRRFLDEAHEEADMRKFSIWGAAAVALILVAESVPADAASRKV
jgi:hypothetical protein